MTFSRIGEKCQERHFVQLLGVVYKAMFMIRVRWIGWMVTSFGSVVVLRYGLYSSVLCNSEIFFSDRVEFAYCNAISTSKLKLNPLNLFDLQIPNGRRESF